MADQTDPFNNQPQDDQSASPQLPQDPNPPAADPGAGQGALNVEHPATDSVEPTEQYQEGLADAAVDNPPADVPPAEESAPDDNENAQNV